MSIHCADPLVHVRTPLDVGGVIVWSVTLHGRLSYVRRLIAETPPVPELRVYVFMRGNNKGDRGKWVVSPQLTVELQGKPA